MCVEGLKMTLPMAAPMLLHYTSLYLSDYNKYPDAPNKVLKALLEVAHVQRFKMFATYIFDNTLNNNH